MPVTAEVTEEKSLNKITSILKITKTAGYYGGQYYCVAENQDGRVVSQIANLYIQGIAIATYVANNKYTVVIHYIFVLLT